MLGGWAGADRGPPGGPQGGLLARLLASERNLQDRNSQMCMPDKNFRRVLEVMGFAHKEAARAAQVCVEACLPGGSASREKESEFLPVCGG